jgi:hypothetical protein
MTCQLKHSNALVGEYHVLSLAEKKNLQYSTVYIQGKCGCFLKVKVNGISKVWKRNPEKVRIPYKYGLYEFGYITELDEVRVPQSEYENKIKGGN